MDIKYLDHPCSISDKKKWNDKGFKVIDSKFDPKDLVKDKPKKVKSKPKNKVK